MRIHSLAQDARQRSPDCCTTVNRNNARLGLVAARGGMKPLVPTISRGHRQMPGLYFDQTAVVLTIDLREA